MQRRTFLKTAVIAGMANKLLAAETAPRKVAVIGHTGRGNYGHGLDVVWQKIPGCEIVAVADADAAGLASEVKKLGIERGFQDYHQMLNEVRPEFVSVAPRHVDQHHDMTLAAIESGAKGIYVEKPFCRTPAEADSIIAAATKHGTKIAVAHRNRYHPAIPVIDEMINAGKLGKIIELRSRGLGDHRGGDEDLWVLGCHIFNLMHHFAGPPKSCSAVMLQDGRRISAADVHPGNEGVGPLAANEVHARYQMGNGVTAYYDSIANDGTNKNGYCLQIIGSEGIVAIHIDRNPLAHFLPGNPYDIPQQPVAWIPITAGGLGKPDPDPDLTKGVANHVVAVRDLIDAVENDREPLCSAADGSVTVEMICAVFESHRRNSESISFPLQERGHALEHFE